VGSAAGSVAERLAQWATDLTPTAADLRLADRSLADTVSVALAARSHRVTQLAARLPEGPRWAVAAHVLDFDDLHMESTTHISTVCVPAALALDADARAYLAGAGVMARLGVALGWPHYSAGWHATGTAGAPASAAAAAVALGLTADQTATALTLAVPGAGGVQRAFGTDNKALQVGFAVQAGIRAAELAADGARADPAALDEWLGLVGGDAGRLDLAGPAVPGGLAIKIYPCCYALQRPISALAELAAPGLPVSEVLGIVVRTPAAAVTPLIHHRPETGLQGKFSLEYGVAAGLLDQYPGRDSFTDAAVRRPAARRLMERVEAELTTGGAGLLDGDFTAEVLTADGPVREVSQRYPPGSPQRPPSAPQLRAKLTDCLAGLPVEPDALTWASAAKLLREYC
jgi:2-methylcitrate dehydratase PrpD